MLGSLFPGGYTFTTVIFWTVIGFVVVGTNLIPVTLGLGVGLLLLESLRGGGR